MNKTININLANMLFHIDENAYQKLQRYLEAIKRSFAGTKGSDEIIADIEARIAELFYEKMEDPRQVITVKQVDEVIAIMGQPEVATSRQALPLATRLKSTSKAV